MLKYILTYLLIGLTGIAFAQKKSTINLIKSSKTVRVIVNGEDLWKVYNGTFQQKFSTLTSDSAYVRLSQNTFDAFGHVLITQGDTLHIYADKLNYNDNTKIAVLTDNVKMVDKDAVLTTNHLTYNTATRVGTYVEGGKLVNKGNTLVSKNGYYYAFNRDAFFRYDVKLTTTDANIVTDTLRYNSGTRIAYFLGPTNIYGKKDKDTLYTENGRYETVSEQAFFGKKNLYKSGTRSLKGDSLFYDRLRGYGKAVKNITFEDKEQKIIIKGNLGEHYKADGRVVVTQNAYAILITETRDSSKADSATLKIDTLKKPAGKPTRKELKQAPKNTLPVVTTAKPGEKSQPPPNTKPVAQPAVTASGKKDTAKLTVVPPRDTVRIKRDSMFIGADTLETQMMTYKAQKDLQEKIRLANTIDTTRKLKRPFVPYKTLPKYIELQSPKLITAVPDYTIYKLIPPPKDTIRKKPAKVDSASLFKKTAKKDSTAGAKKLLKINPVAKTRTDSLALIKDMVITLSDTAKVRILSAHHNVRVYRKDIQSRSDSLFYSSADSVIRSFVKPMVWAENSQLSGDTIYIQMKNKKLDNMDVFMNSFAANVEAGDSTRFNQLGGKRMKAFFKNNKLDKLYTSGNAENVYFLREKGKVTQMHRSLSSVIWVYMKNGDMNAVEFLTKPENRDFPISKAKEEDMILKNFVWKPKERPRSKEDVIHPPKPVPPVKTDKKAPGKTPAGKPADAKPVDGKPAVPASTGTMQPAKTDSTGTKTPVLKPLPGLKKDSTLKTDGLKKAPAVKASKDTVKRQ